jgi:NADH-quinone oxidoreductase subunit G
VANDLWVDKDFEIFIHSLRNKKNACVLLGALALHHANASMIRSLAQSIAEQTGAKLGLLTSGSNSAGGWFAGAIPHRRPGFEMINHIGLNAHEMLEKPRKAYLLLNVEPEFDCANSHLAIDAVKQAKCVIALSMYRNKVLEKYAHVILPIAPFTETDGTFINAWGTWQSFKSVATAFGQSRPAWKVLRVFGNFLNLDGFGFEDAEAVKDEIKNIIEKNASPKPPVRKRELPKIVHQEMSLSRIGEVPIYSLDSLVRRAMPLQATQVIMEGEMNEVRLHPETANRLHLLEGDRVRIQQQSGEALLPIKIDERVAKEAAWIAAGIPATSGLGDLFGEVVIEKV